MAGYLEKRQVTKRFYPFRTVARHALLPVLLRGPAANATEAAYRPTWLFKRTHSPVGAGLPAMVVNDDVCCLNERGVWTSIAGKPAPTGFRGHPQEQIVSHRVPGTSAKTDRLPQGSGDIRKNRSSPTGFWVHPQKQIVSHRVPGTSARAGRLRGRLREQARSHSGLLAGMTWVFSPMILTNFRPAIRPPRFGF
ncbi:hypothetical protein J2Y86_005014 [Pseudomonas migulae]|nr:hypothetical protein [Pseudomonas migulae]